MERTQKEKSIMKLFNRVLTYVILLFAVIAICYSINQIINYVVVKKENTELQEVLTSLKEDNEKLEILNSKLKDKDYFSVYVKDKYQYSSNSESIIPIN